MANLTSYTCENCGGVLNVDIDQVVFDCPFCGAKFDVIDFHRQEMLSQAETCLKMMEFISASEKYKEMYDKDPHDFEALRGMILSAGKIPLKEDLTEPGKLIRHNINGAVNALYKLEGDCAEFSYFEKLLTVFELSSKLKVLVEDKKTLDRDLKFRIKALNEANPYIDKDHELRRIAAINQKNADLVDRKIKDLKQKLSVACDDLKNSEPEITVKAAPPSEPDSVEIEADSESVTNIICAKCAGQLFLDRKRNLCECRSCGVAYGVSLFVGKPNRKAKDALIKREFNEADKRYSYMLMLEPHDFEALRGRVLCSIKCIRVINYIGLSNYLIEKLRACAEYALEKALDQDKPYFEKYIELADSYSRVLAVENKLKPLIRQRDDKLNMRAHIVVDIDPDQENNYIPVARETISSTISELEKKIDKLMLEKNVLVEETNKICSEISSLDNQWIARRAK